MMPQAQRFTPPCPLHTPVLFLIYKRPDTTRRVFEAIRRARPPRLYVAADGPRPDVPGEAEEVQQARDIVTNGVDWDCEIRTLFRDKNLGCKYGVSGGINWFFENEEEGIILEDDTLPSQSFFWFCQELLERYRNDMRIFLITGHNKQYQWKSEEFKYFFSLYGGIWGWATWRNAWRYLDLELKYLNGALNKKTLIHLLGKKQGRRREAILKKAKRGSDTWDYQWAFTRHINNGLACVPCRNLVQNIGFNSDATHTKNKPGRLLRTEDIEFPLEENFLMVPDRDYDKRFIDKQNFMLRIFKNSAEKTKNNAEKFVRLLIKQKR